jgi:hypothetical protein
MSIPLCIGAHYSGLGVRHQTEQAIAWKLADSNFLAHANGAYAGVKLKKSLRLS